MTSGLRRWTLYVTAVAALAPGCSTQPCPNTIEGLRSEAFVDRLPTDTLVGIGRIVRFVDSPDAEFRGYDVAVETRIAGLEPGDVTVFVRALNRLPNIQDGDRVALVGKRGHPRALVEPAGCPALTPLIPGD
jgi:hypothetical protein